MKFKNLISMLALSFVFGTFCFSETVPLKLGDGTIYNAELPSDVANLVRKDQFKIESSLIENNVTSEDLDTAINEINKTYAEKGLGYSPLSSTTEGLDEFSEDLMLSIANAQLMQNVWAEAWIGKLVPGIHMGFGIDAGAGQLKLDAIKKTARALEIDEIDDFPDFLAFPTIAADIRLGGIKLPFDFGFSFMTIDSSKISSLDDALSPIAFDFLTIGFDFRWAILEGKGKAPKLSVGAGYVFTKGSVNMENDYANADLDFNSKNIYVQAQISKKLLFFIPFAGVKLSYTMSNIEWGAEAQWNNIFSGDDAEFLNLQQWGILPTKFEGEFDDSKFIPQIYGGFCFDIFIVNITLAAGWDFANQLFSGAFNFRIAW